MTGLSSSLRIVLVRPRNPLNIGASARAMANFGLQDLVVVDPHEPVWRETISAVGAEELVLKARLARTLDEAIKDCHLVLGTTALKSRQLDLPIVTLPKLDAYLARHKTVAPFRIAVLFGQEKTGLTKKEFDHCDACLT